LPIYSSPRTEAIDKDLLIFFLRWALIGHLITTSSLEFLQDYPLALGVGSMEELVIEGLLYWQFLAFGLEHLTTTIFFKIDDWWFF